MAATQVTSDIHQISGEGTLMDTRVALEGDGPKSGRPKRMDLVLAAANLAGLDATAARIMEFEAGAIRYLVLGCADGHGAIDGFPAVALPISDASNALVRACQDAVSWLELVLRDSAIRRIAFGASTLGCISWCARRYYDIWVWAAGPRLWRDFMRTSPYAEQWR